jgi:hypothetical protein
MRPEPAKSVKALNDGLGWERGRWVGWVSCNGENFANAVRVLIGAEMKAVSFINLRRVPGDGWLNVPLAAEKKSTVFGKNGEWKIHHPANDGARMCGIGRVLLPVTEKERQAYRLGEQKQTILSFPC